jgi:isopentenyldiphosphate isomerase
MAKIIIVDENDNVVGAEERKVAVGKGLIHRIVRVIVENSKGEIYLQKRGKEVPTWPGRWDQSVGGHVDAGESNYKAAKREMHEELGIQNVKLSKIDKWYVEEVVGGVTLKRFNMLFVGKYNGKVTLAEGETAGGGWFKIERVKEWINEKPDDFCPEAIITINKYLKKK